MNSAAAQDTKLAIDGGQATVTAGAEAPARFGAPEMERLEEMIATGRIPISHRNLTLFPTDPEADFGQLVAEHSERADLTVVGFTTERLADKGAALFDRHPTLADVLFVCGRQEIRID